MSSKVIHWTYKKATFCFTPPEENVEIWLRDLWKGVVYETTAIRWTTSRADVARSMYNETVRESGLGSAGPVSGVVV